MKSFSKRTQHEFDILKETLLSECAQGPVYYYPNPGNWGDGVIRYGTIKLLNDINIDYQELKQHAGHELIQSLSEGTVIYGGGGAWCKLWNNAIKRLSNLNDNLNIIVLPSTFESNYSIPNTTFFCRDNNHSKQNMPNATFCHDMAFYIGSEFSNLKGNGKGYFFRRDEESTKRIPIPASNDDISLTGTHLSDTSEFFDEVNRFSIIYTDRLHIAIAACLLNKEVHLYPSSYFKNMAIYKSSMKDYFDNVHFHEHFDL